MSDFDEIERDEIAVQFVCAEDNLASIQQAWATLEAVVALRGRRFYGAFYTETSEYHACVEVRDGDEPVDGLESRTLPGGRYLRSRLHGEPPALYARIGPTLDDMVRAAELDESRPSIEYYRRRGEIELFLPI
jgi:hypothetical protein